MRNNKAIFFCINDDYSFAVSNVIMSLIKNSPKLLEQVDIIIFHNGISNKNQNIIQKLHMNIEFRNILFPENFKSILEHPVTLKWGIYVISKLFGFELVKEYKKVLFLDADMLVVGDISEIFTIKEEIAWRKVIAWNPADNFKSILRKKDDYISACNAGLIYFTDKLNYYNLSNKDIIDAFFKTKDLRRGGTDEKILAYLVYTKGMLLKELDIKFNAPASLSSKTNIVKKNIRIIHFIDFKGCTTKPWKNYSCFLYYNEWSDNYYEWIRLGGDKIIHFDNGDFHRLLLYDSAEKYLMILNKYNNIRNSRLWRLSRPLRLIIDKVKMMQNNIWK